MQKDKKVSEWPDTRRQNQIQHPYSQGIFSLSCPHNQRQLCQYSSGEWWVPSGTEDQDPTEHVSKQQILNIHFTFLVSYSFNLRIHHTCYRKYFLLHPIFSTHINKIDLFPIIWPCPNKIWRKSLFICLFKLEKYAFL